MAIDRIAHYEQGSSDKVYVVSVLRTGEKEWQVIARWGRNQGNLKRDPKGTFSSESSALANADNIFNSKLKKGYQEINKPGYNGTLSVNSHWVQNHLEQDPYQDRVANPKKEPKPMPKANVVLEVVCLNNVGLEEHFDQDVEYVAATHKEEDMIWVHNRFGEKVECFAERFKKVSA